jgi:hypothetical protein
MWLVDLGIVEQAGRARATRGFVPPALSVYIVLLLLDVHVLEF